MQTKQAVQEVEAQLDELVDAWRELADTVAERAVALDYWPDGQARAVAGTTELEPVSSGAIADRDVVELLISRLIETIGRARTRMDRLGALDLASQDVLIEGVRALEQQLWMVRVQRAS
jgi:starvation-inducible DNA-binding protein